jgi:hypothetical protein
VGLVQLLLFAALVEAILFLTPLHQLAAAVAGHIRSQQTPE